MHLNSTRKMFLSMELIHYDNMSRDSLKGFMIAGRANTDLTDIQLLEYNGGVVTYYTTTFSSIIADQQNGYGTYHYT